MIVDDNVKQDVGWLMYEDWDGTTGSIPRSNNDGGYPPAVGNDLRSRFQAGTLYSDITEWINYEDD